MEFTPSSSMGFDPNGSFTLGMEAFPGPSGATTPQVARKDWPIPQDELFLTVFMVSAALRPSAPGNAEDGLFRVWLDGRQVVNLILKSTAEPQNIALPGFPFHLPASDTARICTVEFEAAGGRGGNMELQMCGEWEKASS